MSLNISISRITINAANQNKPPTAKIVLWLSGNTTPIMQRSIVPS